jgi:hypothetical protein
MYGTPLLARCSAAAAAATLIAGIAAVPAAARPDPGGSDQVRFSTYDRNCSLSRIDNHLVRCDYLTGGLPYAFPQ